MIEKAIEHWLTNANELSYQPAFVHALIARGETVLYVSKHRSLEQGKDVATRTADGTVRAYQLKGGRIGGREWRNIVGELDDLVRLPVRQVEPVTPHEAYLVTNGELTDEAAVALRDYNAGLSAKAMGYPCVQVIQRNELLRLLLDVSDGLLPIEPVAARDLFNTYCGDGQDMLRVQRFAGALRRICFERGKWGPAEVTNAITGSVLVASFALRPYREAGNHYAMFEGWTTLAAELSRFVSEHKPLAVQQAQQTLELIWRQVDYSIQALFDEAKGKSDLLEGGSPGDGGDVYRARATLLCGVFAARELVAACHEDGHVVSTELLEFLERYERKLWLWGESAVPALLAVVRCLELGGKREQGGRLLLWLCDEILARNGRGAAEDGTLYSPYYTAEDVLLASVGRMPFEKRAEKREFVGESWMLNSVVWWMVRRGMRQELTERWNGITKVQCKSFKPDDSHDVSAFWSYRSKRGVNEYGFFASPTSWRELSRKVATTPKSKEVWPLWGARVLWFFLVYPHRWQLEFAALLDQQCGSVLGNSGQSERR